MLKLRKGIILAGGSGTRLKPITNIISKQLLPVYDKPMIYYPLSTLMTMKIREVLVITTPHDNSSYKKLLGDGAQWGMKIKYEIQNDPNGIAEAFILGEKFIDNSPSVLVLGDNLFYGKNMVDLLDKANKDINNSTIFAYKVNDPERYGVVEFDSNYEALSIVEKPAKTKSSYAVTGIYFYNNKVCNYAKELVPSKRGELEITDLNLAFLKKKKLKVKVLGSGNTWLDTGTYDSLIDASIFISTLQNRQGIKVACPEQIAFRNKWINKACFFNLIKDLEPSPYSNFLKKIYDEST